MNSSHEEPYREMLRKLKTARVQSGLTQIEVAKALGKHQSYVSKCESGERRVDPLELLEFLALYEMPLEAVLPVTGEGAEARHRTDVPNTSSSEHLRRIESAVRDIREAIEQGVDANDMIIARSLRQIQKSIRSFAEEFFVNDSGEIISGRERIRRFLVANVGEIVEGETLAVVGAIGEWARRVRELRHECGGMQISTGMDSADLRSSQYRLENLKVKPEWQRTKAKVFSEVLKRDGYRCTSCGWSPKDGVSQGRRFLEVNHKVQVKDGGRPVAENLETLCNKCHDALEV